MYSSAWAQYCTMPRTDGTNFAFTTSNSGNFYATNNINATNVVTDVRYIAGNSVTMGAGFKAGSTANLNVTAAVFNCIECSCLDNLTNSFSVATATDECFYGPYMVSTSIYWPFTDSSCEDTNGDGLYTFSWDFGDGVQEDTDNNQVYHIFPATANYMVNVTVIQNNNGCSRSFGSMISAVKGNPCTSYGGTNNSSKTANHKASVATKQKVNQQIVLYPNPVQQLLTVTGSTIKKGMFINVCDINGRKIFEAISEAEGKFELDVSNFAVGVYLLNVVDQEAIIHSSKLIKN